MKKGREKGRGREVRRLVRKALAQEEKDASATAPQKRRSILSDAFEMKKLGKEEIHADAEKLAYEILFDRFLDWRRRSGAVPDRVAFFKVQCSFAKNHFVLEDDVGCHTCPQA